jgi:ABC-type cobalamin/Fe3+-siderophores transport system ATPase subunit
MSDKIKSLRVTNYKGVKEIIIHPEDRSLVVIAGGNGAGKTSFVGGIIQAFDPDTIAETPKPIREGELTAEVEVITSEARLLKKWRFDKHGKVVTGSLDAFALDGAKYPSGRDFVLKATGGAIFDPKEFVNRDEKEQRRQLLALVDLPFDLAALDAERKAAFDGRTDATRELKRVTAVLSALPKPAPDAPAEEVSSSVILADAETARTNNAKVQQLRQAAIDAEQAKKAAAAEVVRLSDALDAARTLGFRAEEVRVETLAAARAGRMVDLEAITARLATVEETNAEVRKLKAWTEAAEATAKALALETNLTAKIAGFDRTKREGLAAAVFPDPLLSIDDDGITYDGIPFRQANTAKKTITAMRLLTTAQPDLRFMVVTDGDSLDDDTLAEMETLANERGYLVLTERDRNYERQVSAHVVVDGEVSA